MIFELRYNEGDDGYDLITYRTQSPAASKGIEAEHDEPVGRRLEPVLRSIRQILRQELAGVRSDGFSHPDTVARHPHEDEGVSARLLGTNEDRGMAFEVVFDPTERRYQVIPVVIEMETDPVQFNVVGEGQPLDAGRALGSIIDRLRVFLAETIPQ